MAYLDLFSYLEGIAELMPAAQTVRAQSAVANVEQLYWDAFFPRNDADSIKITNLVDTDFNPVADRRAWDAEGRLVNPRVGDAEEWEMTPIEAFFSIGEREQNQLLTQTNENVQAALELFGADLPGRIDLIVAACLNRIEMDAFEAWLEGTITVRDPNQENQTITVDLGFASSHYKDYGGAWTNTDAFGNFIDEVWNAKQEIGSLTGCIMPDYVLDLILQDAESTIQNAGGLTAGVSDIQDAAARKLGQANFTINTDIASNEFDEYQSGGSDTTLQTAWSEGHIAFVPRAGDIGRTEFAPNIRARQVANQDIGPEEIDRNGIAVYYASENDGKRLKCQAQVNALPIPNENRVYVVDSKVTAP